MDELEKLAIESADQAKENDTEQNISILPPRQGDTSNDSPETRSLSTNSENIDAQVEDIKDFLDKLEVDSDYEQVKDLLFKLENSQLVPIKNSTKLSQSEFSTANNVIDPEGKVQKVKILPTELLRGTFKVNELLPDMQLSKPINPIDQNPSKDV